MDRAAPSVHAESKSCSPKAPRIRLSVELHARFRRRNPCGAARFASPQEVTVRQRTVQPTKNVRAERCGATRFLGRNECGTTRFPRPSAEFRDVVPREGSAGTRIPHARLGVRASGGCRLRPSRRPGTSLQQRPRREQPLWVRRTGETSSVPSGFLLCDCCLGERCRCPAVLTHHIVHICRSRASERRPTHGDGVARSPFRA